MALSSTMVFECRATGNQENGGGFNADGAGAGTDYSQQDSAHLSLSDIATDGAGTGISSATGGFTTAMQRNCIYLTGGSVTTGWYEIITVADTNNATIERSAGANKTGVTGNVGGAWKWGGSRDTTLFNDLQAGNIVWVKSGTYTRTADVNANNVGDPGNHIKFRGYQTTRGDIPKLTDRPFITGDYKNYFNDKISLFNLVFEGAATPYLVAISEFSQVFNCSFHNTETTSEADGLYLFDDQLAVLFCDCATDSTHTDSKAIDASDSLYIIDGCYLHDSQNGLAFEIQANKGMYINGSIFAAGAITGVTFDALADVTNIHITNCTFYNCTLAIGRSADLTLQQSDFINNLFDTGDTAISIPDGNPTCLVLSNNLFSDFSTATYPEGADLVVDTVRLNPELNDPDNQDFSIDKNSPAAFAAVEVGDIF
jgi:hypothetical protein